MTTETESEFEKKRMINLYAERIATALGCIVQDYPELEKRLPDVKAIVQEVARRAAAPVAAVITERSENIALSITLMVSDLRRNEFGYLPGAPATGLEARICDYIDQVAAEKAKPQPQLRPTIERLFAENPSPLGDDQAPAIMCAIALHGFPAPIQGALSQTAEGGLRLMAPAEPNARSRDGSVTMIEHFFDYRDVIMIAVRREVAMQEPKIIIRG